MVYGYCRAITIDHTKVPGNLVDFPFLFNTTHNDLRTIANGGHVTSASGYDIVFSPNQDGSSRYAHEIEEYNPATGEFIAHVKIPSVSSSVDTVFYIVYGDSSITTSQEDVTNVWDSDFKGVWHLHDDFLDSTSNSNNLINHGSDDIGGKIADGQDFIPANNDYITIPDDATIRSPHTIELWFKQDNYVEGGVLLRGPTAENNFVLYTRFNHWRFIWDTRKGRSPAADYTATAESTVDISGVTDWRYLVCLKDGLTVHIYDGAVLAASGSSNQTLDDVDSTADKTVSDATNTIDGRIDEVRFSSSVRSTDYITATYNNQSNPGTFYSLGGEQLSRSPLSGNPFASCIGVV